MLYFRDKCQVNAGRVGQSDDSTVNESGAHTGNFHLPYDYPGLVSSISYQENTADSPMLL
jgi:hypothetical protein